MPEKKPFRLKKRYILIAVAVILLILLVPIPKQFDDGGSKQYSALIYTVTDYHSMLRGTEHDGKVIKEGYIIGREVELFGQTVYDSTRRKIYSYEDDEDTDPSGEAEPSVTPSQEAGPTTGPTGEVTVEPTGKVTVEPTAEPTVSPEPKPIDPDWKPEEGTPFSNHGKLSVKGTKILDASGKEYQLKGVSTHGLQWFPEYVNRDTFKTIRDEWGANVIRLAMYTDENGYCVGGASVKENLKKTVKNGVKYATELGLYVIIDWHILHDLTPMKYADDAEAFFKEMSAEFGSYDNVLYEICNEPNGGTEWPEIKRYAERIIPVIRANAKDAIIIIGTPTWSQDVDKAAMDPVKGTNLMYALHFYAGTHKDNLRAKMVSAIKAGLPVFVSEYGITDASGNGRCDIEEANKWVAVMDEYKVSYICWNLANKNESSSLIKNGVKKLSGFTEEDLSVEGNWLVRILHGKMDFSPEELEKLLEQAETGFGGGEGTPKGFAFRKTVGSLSISLVSVNTWNEGGKCCYQCDFTIKNNGGSPVNGWSALLKFANNATAKNFWCCKATGSGKEIRLDAEQYNKTIPAKGTLEGVGIIIASDGPITVSDIVIP